MATTINTNILYATKNFNNSAVVHDGGGYAGRH